MLHVGWLKRNTVFQFTTASSQKIKKKTINNQNKTADITKKARYRKRISRRTAQSLLRAICFSVRCEADRPLSRWTVDTYVTSDYVHSFGLHHNVEYGLLKLEKSLLNRKQQQKRTPDGMKYSNSERDCTDQRTYCRSTIVRCGLAYWCWNLSPVYFSRYAVLPISGSITNQYHNLIAMANLWLALRTVYTDF